MDITNKLTNYDELWHAGDWGSLSSFKTSLDKIVVRGVYGNIDNNEVRNEYPKEIFFELEGIKVYVTHIGGYPGKYQKSIKTRLKDLKPDLFICGHSHICKIMKDRELNLLHFNPGAIGFHGFHQKRTMISFKINNGEISDVKIHEYDK